MPDLDERLRGIDRLSPPPDLLSEARAKADDASSQGSSLTTTPMRRFATIVVALVIGLGGVAILVLAFNRNDEQATPAVPMPERIVFTSLIFPDRPGQIFSMGPDGSDVVRLSQGAASYSSVSVSPDGTRIAYVRFDQDRRWSADGPGPEGIYVANPDGTDPIEVFRSSEPPQSLIALRWSPDGESLGFILRSIPPEGGSEADWEQRLWVMGADGSDPHPVSNEQISSFTWSPAGDRFAVTRESVAGQRFVDDIFVVDVDGSNMTPLTSQGASRNPIWSPDGERIMFEEGWSPDGPRAMVMNADGSGVVPLQIQYDGWTEPLAWAPDSEQVLVVGINTRRQECPTLLASATGGPTSLVLDGEIPPHSRPLEPGQTPSDASDPCVQSASWSGSSAP